MAVISPSVATGGRNTGFSYVFNTSRAIFQGSLQSATVKDVTHKSKDVDIPKTCKSEGTVDKNKDDVASEDAFVLTVKTPVMESRAESACAAPSNIGQSSVTIPSDRTISLCSKTTEPNKLVISGSAFGESHNSGNQQTSSSNKRLTSPTNGKKNVRENVNIVTDVLCSTTETSLNVSNKDRKENASVNKTSFRKCQVQTLQNSSPDPLIRHSYTTKTQQTLSKNTISEQNTEASAKHQINCDKTSKLNERSWKENLKANTNDLLNKCKSDVTLSSDIKGLEEKSKKDSTVENKSLSKKKLTVEKAKQSSNIIQQKDIGQNEAKDAPEDGKKSEAKIITQSATNKSISENFQSVSVQPTTNVKPKQNIVSNCTGGLHLENQQMNKNAINEKSGIKSNNEITSKTKSGKSQRDDNKIHIIKHTVEKYKKNLTPSAVDFQRSEPSDKIVSKYQKDTQDPGNKLIEKIEKRSLKTKTDDPSLRESVKERAVSPSRSLIEKRSSDLKSTEVCKTATTVSRTSPNETSGEAKKVENEIDSSNQFTKSQKDTAAKTLPNTPVKTFPKADDAKTVGKFVCSQKQIAKTSTGKTLVDKPQRAGLKNERLVLESAAPLSAGEALVTKSNTMDTKIENRDQTITPEKRSTKLLADKFSIKKLKADNSTDEKMPKDDEKTLSVKAITVSQGSNVHFHGNKILGNPETGTIKVENNEKSTVNLHELLTSRTTEKSRQDLLTNECDEKRTGKFPKDERSDTSATDLLHEEKTKAGKVRSKKVDKMKTQKCLSNSSDSRSGNETEMRSGELRAENLQLCSIQDCKKSFSKSNEEHLLSETLTAKDTTGRSSEKAFVRSQEGNVERTKNSVEKNSSRNFSGTKISTKERNREIIEDDTKKVATVPSDNRSRASNDACQTDKTNKLETSTDKLTIGHRSDSDKTLQGNNKKHSTTFQKESEKVAACGKDTVSKLAKQECKKQSEPNASSWTSKALDNTLTCSDKNAGVLAKSKLEFDNTERRTDIGLTATPKLEEKGQISDIENSFNEKDTSSKSPSQTLKVDTSKDLKKSNSFKDPEENICEVKSPSILHFLGDGFKLKEPEICGEVVHPSRPITDIIINKSSNNKDLAHTTQEESIKCRRYTKENRPCSYPTAERKEFPGLQQKSSSQQSLDYYTRDCTLSAVDYAKTRFQNVQQTPRCDEVVKPKPKHTQMVNEFKSLWENYEQKETGLSIPHPAARKLHMRQKISSLTSEGGRDADFPIRPFLTKGSVAERVLLFECCPERALDRSSGKSKSLLYNTWKSAGLHHKTRFWEVIGDKDRPPRSLYIQRDKDNLELSKAAIYCRFSKSSNIHDIPLFHYPKGRPFIQTEIERQLKEIKAAFSAFTDEKVTKEEFGIITKACSLPLYWKLPLFLSAAGENKPFLKCDVFLQYWKRIISAFHDEASQFVAVLTKCSRDYLLPDDFIPMIQDIIDTHPGLTFLKEATEFHSRYVHTVISRIYYCVNKSWSGKITVAELRKSNFLQIVSLLEKEDDINQITDYFSYEHFYVIYCKFWELDKDHDLFIDKNDLRRHNDGAISSRMIERIFSGAVTRSPVHKDGKMSYTDFVWFLFSEEDKRHPRSIEYWFRCMDLDGDGYLSMYEMEYFYEEQLQRMEALNIETLPFKDCLCQMLDMIRPKIPGLISLADLKRCKMTPLFFDTFFNLEKYLDHEQRDPFASQREQDSDANDMSDWDRYAAEEYELLVAEEGGNEHSDDLIYDDYTQEEDELLSDSQKTNGSDIISHRTSSVDVADDDDYADTDLTYY